MGSSGCRVLRYGNESKEYDLVGKRIAIDKMDGVGRKGSEPHLRGTRSGKDTVPGSAIPKE